MAQFGSLEREVMEQVWAAAEPATVREIHEALAERNLAYTTVMTVLDRLAKKGVVERFREGRAYRYRAAAGKDEVVADLMHEVLDEAGGARAEALMRFVDRAGPGEAEALRAALDQLDRQERDG